MTTLLSRLLEAWRETHDPKLEEPIDDLGAELARGRGPLTAKSKTALEKAWLALVARKDAGDVDRLLDTPWPGAWKTALVRVEALAKLQPDPRIAVKLARIAATYDAWASWPLHRAIARVILGSATKAAIPALDAVQAVRRESDVEEHKTAEIYGPVRAAIESLKPAAAPRRLLEEARGTVSSDVPALLSRLARSPGDLALRAVLADALQAAGDPRGEFIALQLAGGTKGLTRAAQLLKAHIDKWTGPLPNVAKASRRFERGFLVALRSSARSPALERSFDRPEWTTVEELGIDAYGSDLAPLLRRMPLLRVLDCPHDDVLEQVAKGGPFPSILAIGSGSDWIPRDRTAFPNLAVLAGSWTEYRYTSEYFAQLQTQANTLRLQAFVHLGFPSRHLAAAVRGRGDGPPRTVFAIGLSGRKGLEGGCWRVRVHRDAPHAELAWTGGNEYQRTTYLREILAAVSSVGIREVAIHLAQRYHAEAEEIGKERKALAIRLDGPPIELFAA